MDSNSESTQQIIAKIDIEESISGKTDYTRRDCNKSLVCHKYCAKILVTKLLQFRRSRD